jgi:hypothetical protein
MKFIFLVSILFFLPLTDVVAQTDSVTKNQKITRNSLQFNIGINSGFLSDKNFSPLQYSEFGGLYSLQYERATKNLKNYFDTEVDFSSGKIKTPVSSFFTAKYISANLSITYWRKLKKSKYPKIDVFIGAQANVNVNYFNWNDLDAFSFLFTYSINAATKIQYQFRPKQQIVFGISIPVLLYLVRPPYNGFDDELQDNFNNHIFKAFINGETASFNKYFSFSWKTKYVYNLSKRLDVVARNMLTYQFVAGVNKMHHFQNQIVFGINLKF